LYLLSSQRAKNPSALQLGCVGVNDGTDDHDTGVHETGVYGCGEMVIVDHV
jgi:hypothetical protein